MRIRVVQIWGFLMTVLGWIFVACTMAMEGWKISSVGGMGGSSILKVAWYWSSLWRSCFTDSTAVSNCYDFPVLWSVESHIQIVRGLLMAALSVGMLGFVLSMLGMECTFLGGEDLSKYRKIYTSGWCHIISGLLSTSGYAVYAQYVSVEYFNPNFDGLKFDLGTPLFLGWVGSAFQMAGGFFYLWSVCKPLCGQEERDRATAEELFKILDCFLMENGLKWENCISVCSYGAQTMAGMRKGLRTLIKKASSNAEWTHCVIH
ncbi:claudin-10 isoform X3 [Stigmatopora argus]